MNSSSSPPDARIDPITAEIIAHRICAIPNLIDTNIAHTAFSPLVAEYKDFAVGMVDANGNLITQSRGGIPVFCANALSVGVRDGLKIYGKSNLQHGDVVITNDAGTMGQHLNNVLMYTPIRTSEADSGLLGFMAVVVHWVDVGGITIGSCLSSETTDVFQEGVQFHTVKVYSRGEPVEEIFRMIRSNTRFPDLVMGDFDSQLAGCLMGRDMTLDILTRYGLAEVQRAIQYFWHQSEAKVRETILAIPDGTYRASSFLDDDGVNKDRPIHVKVAVHVKADELTVDLSGLGKQVDGPMNAGYEGGAVAAARIACKYFFSSDEQANEGASRPVKVHCPPGTFLSATPGAPLSGSGNMLPTVVDTILRALGAADPARAQAAHHGTYGLHVLTGHTNDGDLFYHMESTIGGWGASHNRDGTGPFRSIVHGDTLEVPAELQEASNPYLLEWVRLRQDSGGAGKYRGGLGVEKCYRILKPVDLTVIMERTKCPPWGLDGGREGETGRVEVHRVGANEPQIIYKDTAALLEGDRVLLFSAGGGGFGPIEERSTDQIKKDVIRGYVSPEAAEKEYGLSSADLTTRLMITMA
ncbi:MAG: 5-oxoprolinase [Rhodospirillaceae bacterium]|nr:5-oxoprolinase [Rhodospirillaceae bacterium]